MVRSRSFNMGRETIGRAGRGYRPKAGDRGEYRATPPQPSTNAPATLQTFPKTRFMAADLTRALGPFRASWQRGVNANGRCWAGSFLRRSSSCSARSLCRRRGIVDRGRRALRGALYPLGAPALKMKAPPGGGSAGRQSGISVGSVGRRAPPHVSKALP
jgi:hypothetical protein